MALNPLCSGNFFRGSLGESIGIDRVAGDHMGMLATVMNSLALANSLSLKGVDSVVMTSIDMNAIAEPYVIRNALSHLENGRVVVAAGGTGHPYFTTDSAASLRAVELNVDLLLKATRVDGVYTSDPEKNPDATKIESIKYSEVLEKNLKIMDSTSIALCKDNNLPIVVFNLFDKGSLARAVFGEKVGTMISN